MKLILEGFNETTSLLNAYPDTIISFESKKGRIVFPHITPHSRILYFPNGEYKVSNTIIYSFEKFQNSLGNELSRQIHFQGQSQSKTIIMEKAAYNAIDLFFAFFSSQKAWEYVTDIFNKSGFDFSKMITATSALKNMKRK